MEAAPMQRSNLEASVAPLRPSATLASRFDRCIGAASILPFQRNAAVKSTGTLPATAKVWEDSMDISKFGRRGIVSGALLAAASLIPGQPAIAQAPKAPVVINVVDVGGALALLQDAIEAYKTKNPTYVSRFTFTKAPAPELPGKLKAMQAANRADIEL